MNRTHLKKVFWPKLGVGRSVQILKILEYSSGLNLAPALILNQNPFFEIGSSKTAMQRKRPGGRGLRDSCFGISPTRLEKRVPGFDIPEG